jgi:hypothetical protein
MRSNPRGDWGIDDVCAVCAVFGATCDKPKRGSHFVVSHPAVSAHLTIPAHRPIKPVYIRLLVTYLERVGAADA